MECIEQPNIDGSLDVALREEASQSFYQGIQPIKDIAKKRSEYSANTRCDWSDAPAL